MIYKVENEYVISSYQVWKPGVYSSKRAANYAFRFDDSYLLELHKKKQKLNESITFEDLQELRKTLTKL